MGMREKLIALIKNKDGWLPNVGTLAGQTLRFADYLVANDVVPVVRCKDCKHYKPRSQSVHWEHTVLCCARSANLKFPPDGFCSYGERKDNGNHNNKLPDAE